MYLVYFVAFFDDAFVRSHSSGQQKSRSARLGGIVIEYLSYILQGSLRMHNSTNKTTLIVVVQSTFLELRKNLPNLQKSCESLFIFRRTSRTTRVYPVYFQTIKDRTPEVLHCMQGERLPRLPCSRDLREGSEMLATPAHSQQRLQLRLLLLHVVESIVFCDEEILFFLFSFTLS